MSGYYTKPGLTLAEKYLTKTGFVFHTPAIGLRLLKLMLCMWRNRVYAATTMTTFSLEALTLPDISAGYKYDRTKGDRFSDATEQLMSTIHPVLLSLPPEYNWDRTTADGTEYNRRITLPSGPLSWICEEGVGVRNSDDVFGRLEERVAIWQSAQPHNIAELQFVKNVLG